jgi:hypothetical protein
MQEVVLNSNACPKFVVLLSIKFINFESLVYIVYIFSLNIFYLRIFQLYLFVYMVDISDWQACLCLQFCLLFQFFKRYMQPLSKLITMYAICSNLYIIHVKPGQTCDFFFISIVLKHEFFMFSYWNSFDFQNNHSLQMKFQFFKICIF